MVDVFRLFPPFMLRFFEEQVTRPYLEHPPTAGWRAEVLTPHWDRHYTRDILNRGRVDFEKGYNALTPDEVVLIYCQYMMQMHVASSFHILQQARGVFGTSPDRARDVVTVDFGCGPLTWGVALAWYYLSQRGEELPADRVSLRYIGVERSPAAIRRAQTVARCHLLFRDDSLFDFFDQLDDPRLGDSIEKQIAAANIAEPLLALNFSYLFASETLDVPVLLRVVHEILERYRRYAICVTFQNAAHFDLNLKWFHFRNRLPPLCKVAGNTIGSPDTVR
jgi:hypothetical protein